ncbi:hypothetical protein Avbf_13202 [Armadillidium vulgare]|nr:hypothetical protein Avbf_13202 [Armadillidium vulgare]
MTLKGQPPTYQKPTRNRLQCCLNCSENPLESNNCSAIDVKDDPFYEQFGIQCLENRRYADSACYCKEEADNLRTFSNGQMKVREIGNTEENLNGSCPAEAVCPFKFLPTVTTNGQERILAGDSRAVQQPSLTAMHTLFIRVHNRIASMLAALHSNYDDEKLFQRSKSQSSNKNRICDDEVCWKFGSQGSKRDWFGHSLIADIFNLSNGNNVQLAESFITHTFTFNFGTYPSDFLNGISNQWSEEVDQNLVSSISNKLFARGPNFNHGLDLYSRNIMRGRDHGLPPYTKWREYCGLPCIHNFTDLEVIMRDGVADVFANLYQSVDDIDLYPAAISEKPEFDGHRWTNFDLFIKRAIQEPQIWGQILL